MCFPNQLLRTVSRMTILEHKLFFFILWSMCNWIDYCKLCNDFQKTRVEGKDHNNLITNLKRCKKYWRKDLITQVYSFQLERALNSLPWDKLESVCNYTGIVIKIRKIHVCLSLWSSGGNPLTNTFQFPGFTNKWKQTGFIHPHLRGYQRIQHPY